MSTTQRETFNFPLTSEKAWFFAKDNPNQADTLFARYAAQMMVKHFLNSPSADAYIALASLRYLQSVLNDVNYSMRIAEISLEKNEVDKAYQEALNALTPPKLSSRQYATLKRSPVDAIDELIEARQQVLLDWLMQNNESDDIEKNMSHISQVYQKVLVMSLYAFHEASIRAQDNEVQFVQIIENHLRGLMIKDDTRAWLSAGLIILGVVSLIFALSIYLSTSALTSSLIFAVIGSFLMFSPLWINSFFEQEHGYQPTFQV